VLLNKRIIKNKGHATVEGYLEEKFLRYVVKQVTFEGVGDRFQRLSTQDTVIDTRGQNNLI